jgi:hypothetical protein
MYSVAFDKMDALLSLFAARQADKAADQAATSSASVSSPSNYASTDPGSGASPSVFSQAEAKTPCFAVSARIRFQASETGRRPSGGLCEAGELSLINRSMREKAPPLDVQGCPTSICWVPLPV